MELEFNLVIDQDFVINVMDARSSGDHMVNCGKWSAGVLTDALITGDECRQRASNVYVSHCQ